MNKNNFINNIIEPKVNIVSYGPTYPFPNGEEITPNDFVYATANITYRDVGALREFWNSKREGEHSPEKINDFIENVAGSGHASMSTTPGFWAFLEGRCSKLVDSLFTGARFGSFMMPSGRRVPINIESIVTPRGIVERGNKAERIYLENSKENINLYHELQERGVSKQEASKIVQYGHKGGGFLFMPLETLIHFSRSFEDEPDATPYEGIEIVRQIESKLDEMGMSSTYFSRKGSPRTGNVNPDIFNFRKNLVQQLVEENFYRLGNSPVVLNFNYLPSKERDKRICNYLNSRKKIFKSPSEIRKNNLRLLNEVDNIVRDFNESVSIQMLSLVPWRVWGEIKRHRTVPQSVESIYSASERALKLIKSGAYNGDALEKIVSVPESVKKNPLALQKWKERFKQSMLAYEQMTSEGVSHSDAIQVVPRGLKLGVIKTLDLYNLTTGYTSLRLCNTAEPEMRINTEKERDIAFNLITSEEIRELIQVKCSHTGFCPEPKYCSQIHQFVGGYNPEEHKKHKENSKMRIKNLRKTL